MYKPETGKASDSICSVVCSVSRAHQPCTTIFSKLSTAATYVVTIEGSLLKALPTSGLHKKKACCSKKWYSLLIAQLLCAYEKEK